MNKIRTADLFSGIGGIRLGAEKACHDLGLQHECVFASEINKDSLKVYRSHFGNIPDPEFDITTAEGREAEVIPDFDILLAGFPCQAFSQAGKKKGFKDETRGTLFFNVASVIEAKNPVAFLLENVKGLTTHNGGRTFNTIKKTLVADLGYHIQCKILNSRDFGVPHNRERIYIVGFRDKKICDSFRFPEPTDSSKVLEDILEPGPVPPRYFISQQYLDTLKNHRSRHEDKGDGFGYVVRGRRDVAACLVLGGMGLERNLIHDLSMTEPMAIKGRKTLTNSDRVRKLTPLECERLQGFEDEWTAMISDTARWDALANSVSVPVIKAIAAAMLKEMTQPSGRDAESFLFDYDLQNVSCGSTGESNESQEKQKTDKDSQKVGDTAL